MAEVHERSGRAASGRRAGNGGRHRRELPPERNQPAERYRPVDREQPVDRNQPAEREPPERNQPAEREPAEREPGQVRISPAVVGACLAGLVLVAYFVWLSIEMGGHSVAGGAPMIAVFVAAALGVGAGALGFLIGRRRD